MTVLRTVALVGNPNVGKSTLFNRLTRGNQHTGNWTGKTVARAEGRCRVQGELVRVVDLPGCYSLHACSEEEHIADEYLKSGAASLTVVVLDATALERGCRLLLEVMAVTKQVVACVNLLDEAARKGITLDLSLLQSRLGVPVVGTSATRKHGAHALLPLLAATDDSSSPCCESTACTDDVEELVHRAEALCDGVIRVQPVASHADPDSILTGKRWAFPVMLALLALVLWITVAGANYPSAWLHSALFRLEEIIVRAVTTVNLPSWLTDPLISGVYRVLAWVVSVMLPPMLLFLSLFTVLEEAGYLPRIAFNLDRCFQRCASCGKQALTMCQGFGCNAVGVTGCRIIESPRERLIAILSNSFVPCNGRFPILIAVLGMFFLGGVRGIWGFGLSALMMTAILALSVCMTFAASRLLSRTFLRGKPSTFVLELPPLRRPRVGVVMLRSVLERCLDILGRAVVVAAPAGLVIWLLANMYVGSDTALSMCAAFLDPFARLLGLDGMILLAFILGIPANEIVIPILIMGYLAQGSLSSLNELTAMRQLLIENGWTWLTAVCMLLFTMMHWPCATTVLTIRRETGSVRLTVLGFVLPTAFGVLACFIVASAARLLGFA